VPSARRQYIEHRGKIKKMVLYTIGVLCLIYLTVSLIIGEGGFIRYMKLQAMRDDLLEEIDKLKRDNEEIKTELERFKNDETLIEEAARKRGFSKEGELIFKFEEDKDR